MYKIVVFLGVLTLSTAQFSFDLKIDGLGEQDDALTVLKKDLEDVLTSVTTLEEDIEALRARSCASISTIKSQMQISSSSASTTSNVDLSQYLLKSELSKQVQKVQSLEEQYQNVPSASEYSSVASGYAADLETLQNTYEEQIESMTTVDGYIAQLVDASEITCTPGWTKHDNHCYAYFRDLMTWVDAMGTCVGHGGYLLEVNTQAELNWIKQFLESHKESTVWVGGTDGNKEGIWQWAGSGEVLAEELKSNWNHGQPDNWLSEEHYMELTSIARNFNDSLKKNSKNFVCEQWL